MLQSQGHEPRGKAKNEPQTSTQRRELLMEPSQAQMRYEDGVKLQTKNHCNKEHHEQSNVSLK